MTERVIKEENLSGACRVSSHHNCFWGKSVMKGLLCDCKCHTQGYIIIQEEEKV